MVLEFKIKYINYIQKNNNLIFNYSKLKNIIIKIYFPKCTTIMSKAIVIQMKWIIYQIKEDEIL